MKKYKIVIFENNDILEEINEVEEIIIYAKVNVGVETRGISVSNDLVITAIKHLKERLDI